MSGNTYQDERRKRLRVIREGTKETLKAHAELTRKEADGGFSHLDLDRLEMSCWALQNKVKALGLLELMVRHLVLPVRCEECNGTGQSWHHQRLRAEAPTRHRCFRCDGRCWVETPSTSEEVSNGTH